MTVKVLPDYEITQATTALSPAFHIDYATIVREQNRILYVKKAPFELIKAACLDGGADYDGRRRAVMHRTTAKHKVPIPIYPFEHIYAFPTHSPEIYECHWIFYHHVKAIEPHPTFRDQSHITFKDHNEPLLINVSQYSLQRQMHQTSQCIVSYTLPYIKITDKIWSSHMMN